MTDIIEEKVKIDYIEDVFCSGCENYEEVASSEVSKKMREILDKIHENENVINKLTNLNYEHIKEIANLYDFKNKFVKVRKESLKSTTYMFVKYQTLQLGRNRDDIMYLQLIGPIIEESYSSNSVSYFYKDNWTINVPLTYLDLKEIKIVSQEDIYYNAQKMIESQNNSFNFKERRTFFISGHRDLTEGEFEQFYIPKINEVIDKYNADFVIGEYEGADIMAQNYLVDTLNYNLDKIFVYHMGDKPRCSNPKIKNFISGFSDDIDRDTCMTIDSDEDIAFVRKGRYESGTSQNIIRRTEFDAKSLLIDRYQYDTNKKSKEKE